MEKNRDRFERIHELKDVGILLGKIPNIAPRLYHDTLIWNKAADYGWFV
jgi:hypothetical protein